jgi:hypothetical protein
MTSNDQNKKDSDIHRLRDSDDEFSKTRRSNDPGLSSSRMWQFISKLLEKIRTISLETWACELCNEMLYENELVVETSKIGKHQTSYLRFSSKKSEVAYERHLLEAHGLIK